MTAELEYRRDAYPEATDYRDTGCSLHPSCLTCPFEQCRFDVRREAPNRRADDSAIAEAERLGLTVGEIAARFGITRRTVFRSRARRRQPV